jgi:hypothetical protein
MIVIAGTSQEAGLAVGGGVAAVDCANRIPNKVVIVFGNGRRTGEEVRRGKRFTDDARLHIGIDIASSGMLIRRLGELSPRDGS